MVAEELQLAGLVSDEELRPVLIVGRPPPGVENLDRRYGPPPPPFPPEQMARIRELEAEAWADVHYEHSGRFSGTLRYDGVAIALAGTGHRDHSTGPRDVGPMLSHTWVHGEFGGGRAFQVFAAHTRPDQRFASAYVATGSDLRAAQVRAVPRWTGHDGDPRSFVVSLDTDDGPAEIVGRTLGQRYHWSALSPWEFAFGADLAAPASDPAGAWPVLETMCEFEWNGERGYGLVEVTRPRSA